jgi:tetratricopeptide (TPR) repeat protein
MSFVSLSSSIEETSIMELTEVVQITFVAFFAIIVYFMSPPKEDYIAVGDYYYQTFDNDAAQKKYELAYYESPTNYASLLRLVRIHNDNGRIHLHKDVLSELEYKKSIVFADTLVHYYPDSAASHFWYGLAKGSLIPFVGIREKITIGKDVKLHIQKSLERDSTFSYSYVVLAIFEREGAQLSWIEKGIVRVVFGENFSGSLATSEQYLKTALRYDSSNTFAYYELFWTYKAMENKPMAVSSLQEVIKRVPNNLREKQQQDEARKYLAELNSPSQAN